MRNLLVLLIILLVSSCDSLCGDEIKDEVISPNGKYVATIFERNCGATTPYISIVSLRLSDIKFDPEDHNNWVFKIYGESDIEATWAAMNKLKISFTGTGSPPNKNEKWRNVVISYD
ncbi:hypothetical protein C8R26_1487 [Nitrosomonas oligotropha]|uniref:Lipoprotein n=1 Tax=Nitrosomonas oligotropha TaxID=42354 RepID=A0A2T5H4M3_9PROT|nr:hypothetical protein [Nitrosomonas oligotropha]PTQ66541.1 hypothetical protein C8R26_1487 [Nitrosomonas oligotropha]